ncbi:MAG: hypothetical protein NTV82_17970 [Candidatus Aminicenantes bacterium]|nr:hypothetical protein [Candidatus Aminicenantes bacterium]
MAIHGPAVSGAGADVVSGRTGAGMLLDRKSSRRLSDSFMGYFLGYLSLNLEFLSGFLYNIGLIVEY